jgi:hypothetical protein
MLKQSAFCREKPDLGGFQGFFEEYVPVFLVCVETYLHRGVHLSFGIRGGAPTSVICARIILYSMFIFSILGTVIIRSIYYHITTTWKEGDGYERYS